MPDDTNANANSASMRRSAFVSHGFESLCLKLLMALSILIALTAIFSNEHFPPFEEQTPKLLNWPIVDLDAMQGTPWFAAYKWINRAEGLAWMLFAVLSCWRFLRFHKSAVEPLYAMAFLLFGISDFIEAIRYPAWLGIWKLYNLLVLLYCRSYLLRVHYIESKVY
jgi:hypothetical protein